jgi:CRP-like cAMP-binding protein
MISPETLKYYPLFANQSVEMLTQIVMLAEEKYVDSGYQLFFEGESAKSLYLVRKGAVVLTMNIGEIGYQKVKELEPLSYGSVIGWSSIVKPHIYRMGAYAAKESRLVVFDGRKLRCLFGKYPNFGYYFMQNIAGVITDLFIGKCEVMCLPT